MRQTIECEGCDASVRDMDTNERISRTRGCPLRAGLFCAYCAEPLEMGVLVVAVGIWCEDLSDADNVRWASKYIRVVTEAEIQTRRDAERSAKEMRTDNGTI